MEIFGVLTGIDLGKMQEEKAKGDKAEDEHNSKMADERAK